MEYKNVSEKIISCAFRVYNNLGFGFLESVYENCMQIELTKAGLLFEKQKKIRVFYDDKVVGDFTADLIINETIIVELKSVRKIAKAHEVQLVNYLVATGKPIGLLINFAENNVEIRRKVRILH